MATTGTAASSVTRIGSGEPDILLLSPSPLDARVWDAFARSLAESGAGAVVASWPGHGPGQVEVPDGFEFTSEVELLADLAAAGSAAGRDPDVVVAVGNDAGAAVHLATLGRVRGVVLVEPGILDFLPELDTSDFEEAVQAGIDVVPPSLLEAVENQDAAAFGAAMVERDDVPNLSPDDVGMLRQVFTDNAAVFFAGLPFQGLWSQWPDALAKLAVPVLVVTRAWPSGEDRPQRIGQALVDRCTHGRIVTVPGTTEHLWMEKPSELLQIVRDFAADL